MTNTAASIERDLRRWGRRVPAAERERVLSILLPLLGRATDRDVRALAVIARDLAAGAAPVIGASRGGFEAPGFRAPIGLPVVLDVETDEEHVLTPWSDMARAVGALDAAGIRYLHFMPVVLVAFFVAFLVKAAVQLLDIEDPERRPRVAPDVGPPVVLTLASIFTMAPNAPSVGSAAAA
ncbi:MAG: hypothetical protein WCF04_06805 [Candidatus Nanopelagicales bacterium]